MSPKIKEKREKRVCCISELCAASENVSKGNLVAFILFKQPGSKVVHRLRFATEGKPPTNLKNFQINVGAEKVRTVGLMMLQQSYSAKHFPLYPK